MRHRSHIALNLQQECCDIADCHDDTTAFDKKCFSRIRTAFTTPNHETRANGGRSTSKNRRLQKCLGSDFGFLVLVVIRPGKTQRSGGKRRRPRVSRFLLDVCTLLATPPLPKHRYHLPYCVPLVFVLVLPVHSHFSPVLFLAALTRTPRGDSGGVRTCLCGDLGFRKQNNQLATCWMHGCRRVGDLEGEIFYMAIDDLL
jgi:hypothetical protein